MEIIAIYVVLIKLNKKYPYSSFFLCQELKSRVSSIQLKSLLDIFLFGFSLTCCPQRSLKVLLLKNATCFLKSVVNCEQNFSFFIF
jgi:hypothetical protein